MIDPEGEAQVASPDAIPSEAPAASDLNPAQPAARPFDARQPRLFKKITVQLDRERPLKLPFKALRIFEEETGVSAWDAETIWAYPWKVKLVLTLLWVALLDDDPSLTLEQLETLPGVEFGNLPYFRSRLEACWGENMPPPDPKPANGTAPNAGPHRTGSS